MRTVDILRGFKTSRRKTGGPSVQKTEHTNEVHSGLQLLSVKRPRRP
jgi:hypothetical protein